jgi:hypothetical protein
MATPTLDEISMMPQGQEELMQHLYANGYATPPPPPPEPAPAIPNANVAPMTPPDRYAGARNQNFSMPVSGGDESLLGGGGGAPAATPDLGTVSPVTANMPAIGTLGPVKPTAAAPGFSALASSAPNMPAAAPVPGAELNAPEIGGAGAAAGSAAPAIPAAPMAPLVAPTKKESIAAGKAEYAAGRPQVTAPVNSEEFFNQKAAQVEYDRQHPWGADISAHPGRGGKILHTLGQVGQIAGEIVAPGVVAAIPGTRMEMGMREGQDIAQAREAGELELKKKTEETRAQHEENVEDVNEQKMKNAEDKLANDLQKITNVRERDLRKQGLKLNPLDPNGPPISLTRDEMSPLEQSVMDLKTANAGAADAKAALDQIKADPNSPQNQASFRRIQIMAQNAATNAGKLGLDVKKYLADYFGMDENFQPLAGVQVTPEGRPVGPKIAGSTQKALKDFNKDYIKPAEDAQRSYELFQDSYAMHKAGKDPTGAESMQALSAHLQTTFGTVKGARITKDMIEHHLHARGITDDAEVAFNKLMNGGVLSDNQWAAFDHLINNSRGLLWKTAVKEGKRASLPINFLPADLERTLNPKGAGAAAPAATAPAAAKPPRPPSPGMEWRRSNKTGQFKEFKIGS